MTVMSGNAGASADSFLDHMDGICEGYSASANLALNEQSYDLLKTTLGNGRLRQTSNGVEYIAYARLDTGTVTNCFRGSIPSGVTGTDTSADPNFRGHLPC